MCLIARHFESLGLPTLILGSALDILEAGKPPRARFVNYPLGFESGRFNDKADQLAVVREALTGFSNASSPNPISPNIVPMDFEWQAGWDMLYEREKGKLDNRSPRTTEPQYQTEEDRLAAKGQ